MIIGKPTKEQIIQFMRESETLKGLPYWIAAFITGIVSVFYAKLFRFGEHEFVELLRTHTDMVFIVTPLGFLVSWFLVYFIAPNAKGSGIPQVLASIEMTQNVSIEKKVIRHLVSLPITIVKIVSSFIMVLCGGAIGREGPTIQLSAYVFHSVGDKFSRVWRAPSQDIFFITGGAAGIAAAFNTPLGGIVYGIEELARSHFNRFKTSLITAVIISGVVAQTLSGPYLFIGIPKISPYSSKVLPYAILIGLVGGIAGALFGRALFYIASFRNKLKKMSHQAVISLVAGLILAVMIVFIGESSATSGKDLIMQFMFDHKEADLKIALLRFFAPLVSYLNGSAGGIFSPALSAGASLGGWVADLAHSNHRNTCIILGMIAFLSGFTAAPFTSFVLVLEMTDRHSILFSMMLASLIAYMVSQAISREPFYELCKEFFIPHPEPPPRPSQTAEVPPPVSP